MSQNAGQQVAMDLTRGGYSKRYTLSFAQDKDGTRRTQGRIFNFRKVYFSEIDKHAIANFKFNLPNAEHIGSVTDILSTDITALDIITFGYICQGFSIAGKGAGLAGERSSLIRYAIEAVRRWRPDVFIWENVKGVLFRKHCADFWDITKAFAGIGDYRLEWQLLNTSWVLPQNRERVYLVGRRADIYSGDIFPVACEGGKDMQVSARQNSPCSPTVTKCYSKQGIYNPFVQVIPSGKDYIKFLTPEDYHRVRMLTEIECERLQGFPDDYTRYGDYNGTAGEIAGRIRYGLLGNAVSVPVVRQIGSNIKHNTIMQY